VAAPRPAPQAPPSAVIALFALFAPLAALLVPLAPARAQGPQCPPLSLATVQPYLASASVPDGGALYFGMTVTKPGGVRIQQLETNIASPAGTPFTLNVWARVGPYQSAVTSSSGWILAATGTGVSAGPNQPSLVDVNDVLVPTGLWGVCLAVFGAEHAYTAGNGLNQSYSNSDLALSLGSATDSLFSFPATTSVVWNGRLIYECTLPAPQYYCASGVSTNQCTAYLIAPQNPSASLASSCAVFANQIEGQKQGLLFYGVDNSGFTPTQWGSGSSFLCVKSPVQRTGVQFSNGTLDQCDGEFFLDWNAYQLANPTALGRPFSAGDKVYVQAWLRDPPASKSTSLSNAVEMTMLP